MHFLWILLGLMVSFAARSEDQGRALLYKLAEPIANCVSRADTNHFLFRGCIDWHSAVHGAWALAHIGPVNPYHERLISQHLERTQLNRELAYLRENDRTGLRFEMPYGRAWFIQLALVAPYRNDPVVREIAQYCAETLMRYARSNGGRIDSSDYENASWYLFNLWQWYESEGNKPALEELRELVRRRYGAVSSDRFAEFRHTEGFFPPKELALMLLLKVLPKEAATERLLLSMSKDDLSPIAPPFLNAHRGGLNFSRAWGLHAAWRATGNERYCSAYRSHLRAMFASFDYWSKNYRKFGHWVGQFGVFAIMLEQAADKKCGLNNI